ncbi:MAG: HAMP domain-containing histidine kinase [Saprospiraceae bacterium]|nr:HAMP domain-containing histidine kinase [Saprospiraceae bacterium]
MNLTFKTILYYLVIAVLVFSVGGVVAYRLISEEIAAETDYYMTHSLEIIEYRLQRAVERGYKLENRFNTSQLQVKELMTVPVDTNMHFSDTLAMHPHLNQLEMMRKLQVNRMVAGKYFEITMIDVIIEDSDIYESVVKIIIRLFALFTLVMIIGTFIMSRSLLNPFKETLNRIKKFNVQDPSPLVLPPTSTTEFRQLNNILGEMAGRAQQEYQALKKFSENASHEMQTPLAIASGKLDLLTDTDNLTEEQFGLVMSAQQSLKKLSQLGQSLSLLTKIENKEFIISQKTDVSEMLEETLDNFKEFFEMKGLNLKTNIKKGVKMDLNAHLGSILLNNLVNNSIKHNIEGGTVEIVLEDHHLQFRNTGEVPTVPTAQLFNRFEKNGSRTDSSGLGLAIVKEICDYHSIKINYTYDNKHQIDMVF